MPDVENNVATEETRTLLDDVKTALRITHDKLDNEINDNILAAELELQRVGIPWEVASEPEAYPQIKQAIKTYCQEKNAIDQAQAEKYRASFELQAENLRKSGMYKGTDCDAE